MWLHVAAALALVPILLWHVLARRTRPRRSDLSRRTVLRAGAAAAVAAGIYAVTDLTVRLARVPGARRRFTGSYETVPHAMPETSWLDDRGTPVDPAARRLSLMDGPG